MLNTQKVANYLNGRLDALGDLKFDIKAETGKHRNNSKVNGIVRVVGDNSTNRFGFVNVTYNYVVELVVPAGVANDNYIKLQDIVNELIDADNGKEIEIGNGTGIITFNVGKPENFKIDAGVGEDVPLVFQVRIFYTEGGVLGGGKHWLLDGDEIPFIKEQVMLQKEAKNSKIKNKETSQSAVTGQNKIYNFVLQYDSTNLVCQKLQKAIIDGDFDKKYYLSYYDGVIYTSDNPFRVCVSLLNTGNASNDVEQVGMINVAFMEADDVEVSKFRAFINLISFPFYDNDDNTLYASNPETIASYMTNHSMGERVPIEAPNIDNLTITSQIVDIGTRTINEVFRYNYAQIDLEKYDDNNNLVHFEKYYYFITSMTQGAKHQVIVDLKMDTVQTYLMASVERPSLLGFIERASLDRFKVIDNTTGLLKFDNGLDSWLFEREDTKNVSKRLISRKPLGHIVATFENERLNNWLKKNVFGWQYYYVSATGTTGNEYITVKGYTLTSDTQSDIALHRTDYTTYSNSNTLKPTMAGVLLVLAIPVMKNSAQIKIVQHYQVGGVEHTDTVGLDKAGLQAFNNLNNGFSRIVAVKFSTIPPFKNITNYTIGGTNDLELEINATDANVLKTSTQRQTIDQDSFTGKGLVIASNEISENMEIYYTNVDNPIYFARNSSTEIGQTIGEFWKSAPSLVEEYTITRPNPRYIKYFKFSWENWYSEPIPNEITTAMLEYTHNGLKGMIQINSDKMIIRIVDTNQSTPSTTYLAKLYVCAPKVIGEPKSPIYNPKLLSSDFKALKLTNERGEGFEYDLQKLNNNVIETKYTEPLTPDITRSYFRITNTSGVYAPECDQNLTGFVDSADMSLMSDNAQLAQMLAENKNYYLQKTVNTITGAFGGAVGGAIVGKGTAPTAIAGSVISAITTTLNDKWSEDNMRNSPNTIKNANGNAYFNVAYTTPAPTIEEYDILPAEKEIVNDYMVQFGFTYNQIGNVMDFIHKRKYFSYVKAQLDAMYPQSLRCNNLVFADLKARFSNGIRFWNLPIATDEFVPSYEMENYERMLGYDIIKQLPETVTSSNTATIITPNDNYSTTIRTNAKHLYKLKVIVGNTVVKDSTYLTINHSATVNITNVNDDIVIIAETKPIYNIINIRDEHANWSPSDTQVIGDLPYTATITTDEGYELNYIKVFMNGVLIIERNYEDSVSSDTINIEKVIGYLTLEAHTRVIEGD